MVKKLILAFICIISISSISNATNYVQIGASSQEELYVDKDSINVVRYQPPYYVIDTSSMVQSYSKGNEVYANLRFFYNYDTKEMKFQVLSDDYHPIRDVDSNKDYVTGEYQKAYLIGIYTFYNAYNIKFNTLD